MWKFCDIIVDIVVISVHFYPNHYMYEHKGCSEALNSVTNVLVGSKHVVLDTKSVRIP